MTKPKLKVNVYTIVSKAIEYGILGGLNKHEKYCDEQYVRDSIEKYVYDYIMMELCEVIDFD